VRIAITGHRGLPAQTEELVSDAIRREFAQRSSNDELTGITCLADGADQIFARAVLDAGGSLKVIVPAAKYRDGLPAECHAEYDELISKAADIHRLDYVESTEQAHMAASRVMLQHADQLIAIWDGKPARGYGGTADVVQLARDTGADVLIIWPPGASRD
jgi:hypothetical protein